ncbi:MAG: thiamine pyrophosphate-dependent dehydrogenase E1 component subunit alpha [Chthoniobacterales bacterium]
MRLDASHRTSDAAARRPYPCVILARDKILFAAHYRCCKNLRMLQTAERGATSKTKAPPHERYLEGFRWMLLARILEDKLASLYRGGMITGGVYIGRGQEAVSAACGMFLQKGDVFAPLIRDQAGRSAFGEPLLDVARTYLGSRQGPMRGRDGNIHRGRPREGQLAMISHLGAMIPVVVGKLLAKRMKGEKGFVGLTTIGEGGMQTGATHEGMNIAAVEQVPLVVVATNNHFAYSTPNEREFACADLVDRAIGYGYEGSSVDGTDLAACLDVIGSAVKRARAGRPPQLVVASILRLSGHGEHDDASYVTADIRGEPFAQDALQRAETLIVEQELADPEELRQWRADAAAQVDEAVSTAQKEAAPVASEEDWCAVSTPELVDQIP